MENSLPDPPPTSLRIYSPEEYEQRRLDFQTRLRNSRPSGYDRLNVPIEFRLPFSVLLGGFCGGALGVANGSNMAGLVFRAENAHRLPDTHAGWYFYHKTKNYIMMYGGIKEGAKKGALVATWVGAYVGLEETMDKWRGKRDFASSVFAGTGCAAGWSAWNRFPKRMALRTTRMGFLFGAGFGLVQDALSVAKGREVAWWEFCRTIPERVEGFRKEVGEEKTP